MSTSPLSLSTWARNVSPSPTLAIDAKAKALQAAGEDVCGFAAGEPDFDTPEHIKEAAIAALKAGKTKYAPTPGIPELRKAIAERYGSEYGLAVAPEQVVVSPGGKFNCYLGVLATCSPGDEVIIFQPFYENYGPDALLTGAKAVWVPLHPPHWQFDPDEFRKAFSPRTRAIIVNTPNNPTGRVFTRQELTVISELCQEFDALALADEIYEYIRFVDAPHISIATLPGMADRTVTISGLSKTFSMTGWRLGYCIAPPAVTDAIRKAHDFLTVGAPHPLQVAGAVALALPQSYYDGLRADYMRRRDILLGHLSNAGFTFHPPEGAYYVMTDIAQLDPSRDGAAFVRWMIEHVGVSAVPGGSFYSPREQGRTQVRFMFAKRDATLHQAGERLMNVREKLAS